MENFEKFTNNQVAESFEPTFGIDCIITKQQVYHGQLSNITPEMAEAMIAGGSNLIRKKSVETNLSEAGQ